MIYLIGGASRTGETILVQRISARLGIGRSLWTSRGKKVTIEPNSPSPGGIVAFTEDNGAPIEFLQIDRGIAEGGEFAKGRREWV